MVGETILCFSTRRWDSLWRNTQQIMSRIAKQNRVIYFEPGRDPDKSMLSELIKNAENYFKFRYNIINKNLIVIRTPSSLPYARRHLPKSVLQITTPWVAKYNSQILLKHAQKAIVKFDVKNPILWFYEPRQVELIGKLGEKLTCYFNYDEFSSFVENVRMKQIILEYDNRLTKLSDIVLASGRAQWEQRKEINPHTYFIPNGVDFELFHKAQELTTEIPSDVLMLTKPIIGYVGWLGNQIDLELLWRVAGEFSQCSLLLVGQDDIPRTDDYNRLCKLPNVLFVGRKNIDKLPGYLKSIDVALIPYLLEGYTLTAYPLKLHEYLAAGKAIVATALPELKPFTDVVSISATHDEFINHIRDALNNNSPLDIETRIAVARENTWDKRVAEIYRIFQARLSKSSGGN